jgi:hypothetical protein
MESRIIGVTFYRAFRSAISCPIRTPPSSRFHYDLTLIHLRFGPPFGFFIASCVAPEEEAGGISWAAQGRTGPVLHARTESSGGGCLGCGKKKRGEEEMGRLGNMAQEGFGFEQSFIFSSFESNLNLNRIRSSPIWILILSTKKYKIKCNKEIFIKPKLIQ